MKSLTLCLRKINSINSLFENSFSVSLAGSEGGGFIMDGNKLGPWQPNPQCQFLGLRGSIENSYPFQGFNGEKFSILDERPKWVAAVLASSFKEDKQGRPCPVGAFCALSPNGNGDMAIENPFVFAKFFPTWLKAKLNDSQIVAVIDSRFHPPKIKKILEAG